MHVSCAAVVEPIGRPSSPASVPASVRRRRLGQRGISLVEVSVVVTITGILATLATYSVRERMFEAHSVEAVTVLGSIRSGLLAKADDLTGKSAHTLQIAGRVGGFGGPLGLPGVLGKKKADPPPDSGSSGNGNGNGNGGKKDGGIDGDGNSGHGNNPDHCDPDNPGNGGKDCGGGGDGASGNEPGGGTSSGDGNNSGGGNTSGGGDAGGSGSNGSQGSAVDGDSPLCTSADPVPSSIDAVKGHVYQSRANEWQAGSRDAGWECLSVSMNRAQRFQYGYDVGTSAVPSGDTPPGADASFAAWARGDLDGDGRTSWFVLSGAAFDGRVVMVPALTLIDPGE